MKSTLIFLLLYFFFLNSYSQSNKKEESDKQNAPILFEPILSYSEDTTNTDLFIIYRIKGRFLFFSKKVSSNQEIYTANADLIFEILNENNITISREFKPIQITRNSPVVENEKIEDIQGLFKFKLKSGIHRIAVELKDYESNKTFIDKTSKFEIKVFEKSSSFISSLTFIEPFKEKNIERNIPLIPLNIGHNVLIGQKCNALFQFISFDTLNNIKVNWSIKSREDESDTKKIQADSTFFIINGNISIKDNISIPSFFVKKGFIYSRLIILPIPIERLENGSYRLTINLKQGNINQLFETDFNVIWPFKPRSLSNIRLAINALKHIASEEEMQQISSFSITKAKKAFYEFWKKRNPDTTSAFNPSMAEYYRRVDEAIRKFSKESESDGYLTDQGKIFILFGSPTRTNRLLKPDTAPTEIWTYEIIRKRFIFKDEKKAGNFILIRTEEY